ncbi:MAG: hypothetical protein M3N17_09730 [Actinomycetota bacterium]|nr:hypothetical protein [Actinomycetota bacterium]
MRFRLGLVVGFGVGYTMGAKAGTERYLQIKRAVSGLKRSEPAQQISTEIRDAAAQASQTIEHKASDGVSKVTRMVRGDDAVTVDTDPATQTPPR